MKWNRRSIAQMAPIRHWPNSISINSENSNRVKEIYSTSSIREIIAALVDNRPIYDTINKDGNVLVRRIQRQFPIGSNWCDSFDKAPIEVLCDFVLWVNLWDVVEKPTNDANKSWNHVKESQSRIWNDAMDLTGLNVALDWCCIDFSIVFSLVFTWSLLQTNSFTSLHLLHQHSMTSQCKLDTATIARNLVWCYWPLDSFEWTLNLKPPLHQLFNMFHIGHTFMVHQHSVTSPCPLNIATWSYWQFDTRSQ